MPSGGFSRCKHPHIQIDAAGSNHTTYIGLVTPRIILPPHPIDRRAIRLLHNTSIPKHVRRPPDTADEMPMHVIERLDALPILRQVPAANRLVVGDAEQILAAGMEDEATDPVVVPNERLDQRASRVPDLNALVPRPRRDELRRAASGRRFLQAGEGGEVGVCGGRGDGAAFDDVFVPEEGSFCLAGRGVPEAGCLVVTGGEEPAAVEARGDVADPVGVAAERLHAVAGRDVPDAEGFVARGGDEQVPG